MQGMPVLPGGTTGMHGNHAKQENQDGLVPLQMNVKKGGRPTLDSHGVVRFTIRLPKVLINVLSLESKQKGYKTTSAYIRKLLEGE